MKTVLQLEGAAESERDLATLPDRIEKKVIRQAVRAAQKIMQSGLRASARSMVGGQMGGRIAAALQVRAPKRQRKGGYSLNVLIRSDDAFTGPGRRSGRKTYIPAAIEYGHITGGTYVPAIPFARTGADGCQAEVMRKFSDEMRIGILREAVKGRSG
jgi:hypothetical protein